MFRLGLTLIHHDLILLHLQRPYFQIRSILRFQVDISFRGDPVQLTTQAYGFCLNKSVINTQLSKGILFC